MHFTYNNNTSPKKHQLRSFKQERDERKIRKMGNRDVSKGDRWTEVKSRTESEYVLKTLEEEWSRFKEGSIKINDNQLFDFVRTCSRLKGEDAICLADPFKTSDTSHSF
jgi:hypothetical protein